MVIEAGVVAGYVIAWVVRKTRRVADRLDTEADAASDAGLDKLRAVVAAKLDRDPVLEDLDEEAAAEGGQVSELTRQRVELAVTAAARRDEEFGQAVTELVAQLRAAEQACGVSVVAGAGPAGAGVGRDGQDSRSAAGRSLVGQGVRVGIVADAPAVVAQLYPQEMIRIVDAIYRDERSRDAQ